MRNTKDKEVTHTTTIIALRDFLLSDDAHERSPIIWFHLYNILMEKKIGGSQRLRVVGDKICDERPLS